MSFLYLVHNNGTPLLVPLFVHIQLTMATTALAIFIFYIIIPISCLSLSTTTSSTTQSAFATNISPIAFGTLNPTYDDSPQGIATILDKLPKSTLIDTAERYGKNKNGDAEMLLGAALQLSNRRVKEENVLLCSKFAPKPWRVTSDSVVEACRASIQRLGVDSLYLYQLHYSDAISQPFKIFGYTNNKDEIYWEGLVKCYNQGLVQYIGVCNYGPQNLRAAHDYFTKQNVPLVSNQINFNLMRYRSSMETKQVGDELGIQTMGYHTLGGGVLTGKYDDEWFSNVPGGLNPIRSKSTRVRWYQTNCKTVINSVRNVAERRGKSPAQVAINWSISKGVIPLCAARDTNQALEAIGASEWRLSESEIKELDEASNNSQEYAMGFELI